MALIRANTSGGGSGGGSIDYTIESVGGVLFIVKDGEVVYNSQTAAFYKAIDYGADDEYLALTKTASSYSITVTYKKACEETSMTNGGVVTTTSKSANSTSTMQITEKLVTVKF